MNTGAVNIFQLSSGHGDEAGGPPLRYIHLRTVLPVKRIRNFRPICLVDGPCVSYFIWLRKKLQVYF